MLLKEKHEISEVSEFSILPYIQNGKLRNLGNCWKVEKGLFKTFFFTKNWQKQIFCTEAATRGVL